MFLFDIVCFFGNKKYKELKWVQKFYLSENMCLAF